MDNKQEWISAYIYYNNLDFLIKNGLIDFLNELKSVHENYIYFFIRYNDSNGIHLRLRIKMIHNYIDETKVLIYNYFNNFIQENLIYKNENNFKHVQFIKYIPEIERYGGNSFILKMENIFHQNSILIINTILLNKIWNKELAIGKSLVYQLIFMESLRNEKIRYDLMKIMKNSFWNDETSKYLDTDSHLFFKKKYISNKDKYNEIFNSIKIEILLNPFYIKLNNEFSDITELIINENEYSHAISILYSFIHMMSNRLGLYNQEECFIAHIIYHMNYSNK